jgi:hypothetical protein
MDKSFESSAGAPPAVRRAPSPASFANPYFGQKSYSRSHTARSHAAQVIHAEVNLSEQAKERSDSAREVEGPLRPSLRPAHRKW